MMMKMKVSRKNARTLVNVLVVGILMFAVVKGAEALGLDLDNWFIIIAFIPIFFGIGAAGAFISGKICR